MLIVAPNSTCDVCMENYMDGAGAPHAIACGHVFCRGCLDGVQPLCPLCRDAFAPQDIRKLCVDADGDASGSTTVAPQVDTHVQRLLGDIANTAGGSATVEQVQKVIDQCRVYHNAQPDSPHTPLGVSYLLLSTLLEAQRKLLVLASELEAAQRKYQHLEQTRTREKETAHINEKIFRAQYKKMNAFWKWKVDSTREKYEHVLDELDRLLSPTTPMATHGKASTIVDCRDTGVISRRTVAADNPSVVAARLDRIKSPPFRLEPYIFLVFNVIAASVGCVLFLLGSGVVLQLCAK